MTRKVGIGNGSNTLNVLVADSTPLTGSLIAEALRRDRTLSVANANRDSVLTTAASAGVPHVVILSEAWEGISGRGFGFRRNCGLLCRKSELSCCWILRSVRWWWKPFAEGHEEYFAEAIRPPC